MLIKDRPNSRMVKGLETHFGIIDTPGVPARLMLSSLRQCSGKGETRIQNPEREHREQNDLLPGFPCRQRALVRIYPSAFRTDDRIIALFYPFHDTNQEKKKIIIKFYKLAATTNKHESTIRNESEALTQSPLRTITLM